MTEQVKKAIEQIEKLPPKRQEEIGRLIQHELSWDTTFANTQDDLSSLAKEAVKEYKKGKTSDEAW